MFKYYIELAEATNALREQVKAKSKELKVVEQQVMSELSDTVPHDVSHKGMRYTFSKKDKIVMKALPLEDKLEILASGIEDNKVPEEIIEEMNQKVEHEVKVLQVDMEEDKLVIAPVPEPEPVVEEKVKKARKPRAKKEVQPKDD